VENAVKHVWSNGPVEGHINRLKTLKRQMYGRAKFELLRAVAFNGAVDTQRIVHYGVAPASKHKGLLREDMSGQRS
jgi:hypothetical protein